MKNLKVFILDECFWVNGKFIYILGTYSALEILSLYKCKKLFDFDIRYLTDFNKLRIIDCRFSGLGNEFFKYMTQKTQLQEMYFENYLTMYFPTKIEREKELNSGSQPKKYSYYSKVDDIALWDKNVVNQHFGEDCDTRKRAYGHVNYCGTTLYSEAQAIEGNDNNFKSILYEPPYDKCTCGLNSETIRINTAKTEYLKRDIGHDRFPREVNDPFELRECTGYIYELSFRANDPRNFRKHESEICIRNDLDLSIFEHTTDGSDDPRNFIIHHQDIDFNEIYPQTYRRFTKPGDVTGTVVSKEGIEQFLRLNPDCRIIHEIMCTCKPKIHF
nr:uncharacterized protein LOC111427780 [Onthophagus taurus]